jgi:rhodanese-related sulfurtransferase
MREISLDELKTKLARKDDFVLVEALPAWQYRKQHLPGAINVPFNRVDRVAAARLPQKNKDIVIYCGKFT